MPNCAGNLGSTSRRSSRNSAAGMYTSTVLSGPNSRRSSGGGTGPPGSRRGSSVFLEPQDSFDSIPPGMINASTLAATAAQPATGYDPNGPSSGQTLLQSIGSGVVGAANSLCFVNQSPQRFRKTSSLFSRPNHYF